MTIRRPLVMGLGILWLAQVAGAAEPKLLTLGASPNPVQAGQTVELTLTKKGPKCAVLVNYGAGTHHIGTKDGNQQVKLPALFANAGTYTISAVGKKKGNRPRCKGSVPPVTVVVKASVPAPPGEQPPKSKGPKLGTGQRRSKGPANSLKVLPPTHTDPTTTPKKIEPFIPAENEVPDCPGCLL
ncbi:MAG: hypothetical protein GY937_12785 [bacterium]|nr:hypothetical protein [bacterium]